MSDEHVLIVEDEPDLATLYAEQLAGSYRTTVANDAAEALQVLEECGSEVDVVLLDRRLPDRPGDEVLGEIRDRELDCSVAMVTAVDPDFDIVRMGFDDYLKKAVTGEELRETVDRLVERSGYDEQVREYLSLVERKATLEAEKSRQQLESSEEYRRLEAELSATKERLDASLAGDVFVRLLLEETGDWLLLVVQYGPDGWEYRYVDDSVEKLLATNEPALAEFVEQCRREGTRKRRLNRSVGLDGYRCSLHLFGSLVTLDFPLSDGTGVVCGFDPEAASRLTDFVSLVGSYLRRTGLEETDWTPSRE